MTASLTSRALALRSEGSGERATARALGTTRHQVRAAWANADRSAALRAINGDNATALYEAACTALAQATDIVAVKDVHDRAAAIAEYHRLMGDREGQIRLGALQIKAEWRMGQLLREIKETTGLAQGRRTDLVPNRNQVEKPVLAELRLTKKESAHVQKVGSISERAIEARIANWRERMERGAGRVVTDILREGPINGARAVMAEREEPDDSLDFFPTPPWATRALFEHALRRVGVYSGKILIANACDPAAGEGHIADVLCEYFDNVMSSDVHDYGYEPASLFDFLKSQIWPRGAPDWIITNPPFSGTTDRALEFTLHALELARFGVAMFVRTQWATEGVERYEHLFRDRPPTLFAPFVERVNLCKGRWDPDGGTATAYCWLVWIKGREPLPPLWIPPGCRKELTRPDDRARFAAWSIVDASEVGK